MNAPNILRHPKPQDYEPTVRAFLPGSEGQDLRARCGLLLMRDRAMASMSYYGEEGQSLLQLAVHITSRDAFRPMAIEDLRELHRLTIAIVTAASGFEALRRRAEDRGGGTDAGAA